MADGIDPTFEELYRGERSEQGLVPWDIGGPQPVVQQLVAFGGVRGEVLDPGTGPGYHAIHFAAQGLSATGVDGSPSAIERAKRNAENAGVQVDFRVADATKLDGFEGRFDTVVDSAFYHVFMDDEDTQGRYAQALHRATKPGARLFMFEFGRHNVNGLQFDGLPADNFERVLGAAGWRVDYLGTSTYVGVFRPQTLAFMQQMMATTPDMAKRFEPFQKRLKTLEPLLDDHRVHFPIWAVAATRLD
ncbi:MAG TPA: class I SAM-dependent methyltransferase [Mycobacterium sp.]|uniref:class I SAM-dependent methyltransferase n=1 Tax=Mycobacterium sp. TaxID=1785 RepID=UPI002D326839|nr:class I SAM-dependent methyltransferase [Mycobacterium sp.]HZU47659.1 class I SAM-dependent methyltransferase [Mycobacterium sp.]